MDIKEIDAYLDEEEYWRPRAAEFFYEGHDDLFEFVAKRWEADARWGDYHRVVIKEKSSGNFYEFLYFEGATENQDDEYYGDVKEVVPRKKVIEVTEWVEPV